MANGSTAATVLDHVDLEEAWRRVAPVGEGAHRNTSSDGRAHCLAALALPVDVQARGGEHAVDGRCADLQHLAPDDRSQVEMTVTFHDIDQQRDQRPQPFAADPICRLPKHRQRLANRLVVETIPCWRSTRLHNLVA